MSTTTTTTVWSDVVAFFQTAEADVAKFLGDVASGAEILIEDIEDVAAYVEAHLGIITSTITTLGTLAATVAPNNTTVTKVLTDLQTAATDTAALSTSLTSGTASSIPQVTTAVTAINSVNTLASLAAQASTALGQIVAASPSATQVVSPASPPAG